MNNKIEGSVSSEVAFFLKGLCDYPERIGVGEIYYGTDLKEQARRRDLDDSLRSLIEPLLQSICSNPEHEIVQKAAEYLRAMPSYTLNGTCLFSFEGYPEKKEEVLAFFESNEVSIPSEMKNIRDSFTF